MITFADLGPAAQEELSRMSDKQRLFIKYIVEGKTQAEAYRLAYNSTAKNLRHLGSVEYRKKNIQLVIEEIRTLSAKEFAVDADRIVKAYAELAFADIREFFDENGNLIPIKDLPKHLAGMITSFDQEEITVGSGDERRVIGSLKKVRLINRKDALDSLAKTQGLFATGRLTTDKSRAKIVRLPTKASEEDWQKTHANKA